MLTVVDSISSNNNSRISVIVLCVFLLRRGSLVVFTVITLIAFVYVVASGAYSCIRLLLLVTSLSFPFSLVLLANLPYIMVSFSALRPLLVEVVDPSLAPYGPVDIPFEEMVSEVLFAGHEDVADGGGDDCWLSVSNFSPPSPWSFPPTLPETPSDADVDDDLVPDPPVAPVDPPPLAPLPRFWRRGLLRDDVVDAVVPVAVPAAVSDVDEDTVMALFHLARANMRGLRPSRRQLGLPPSTPSPSPPRRHRRLR